MSETRPPTGDRIAAEIEREMEDRLFRLRHVVLPPAEYYVYLHEDDYRQIEGVIPRVVLDVQMCLNALVDRLNRQSPVMKLVQGKRAPVEIPAGGWSIHIGPAVNNDVGRGELGIQSRLCIPAAAVFGSGAGTTRIFQTVVNRAGQRIDGGTESFVGPPPPPPDTDSSRTTASSVSAPPAAQLSYTDDGGPHVYALTKEVTRIGRGGPSHPVDLALVTGSSVSREHCRIRRDPHGRCFVQDVSGWGTSVNGRVLPKYVNGDANAAAAEQDLTDGVVIQLATTVTLTFKG